MKRLLHLAVVPLLIACSGEGEGGGSQPKQVAEDERTSVGVPPPPDAYCKKLGYPLVDSRCQFPDGTSCEKWSFYGGTCGQPHSYCALHGGTISTKTENMGSWTAQYAVCDLAGKQCKEDTFFRTEKCEP
jgi:putative hemolysin